MSPGTSRNTSVWDRWWSSQSDHLPGWDVLSGTIIEELCRWYPSSSTLLEVGSGTGRITSRLQKNGYPSMGCDPSAVAIKIASRHEGRFLVGDGFHLPLADSVMDGCWSSGVLEHYGFEDRMSLLREIARVLKPGGCAVVFVPFSKCLPYRFAKGYLQRKGRWPFGFEDDIESLAREGVEEGLTLVKEYSIGWLYLVWRPLEWVLCRWFPRLVERIGTWSQNDLLRRVDRWLATKTPGYLLVSVFVRDRTSC